MARRNARRLLAAALLGATGAVAFAADAAKPADAGNSRSFSTRLFGESKPKPTASTPARPAVIYGPLSPEIVAESVRAEQDALLRRMDVCDQLRKLGNSTNDPALVRQAEELERQATSLYQARVARLGIKSRSIEPDPAPVAVPSAPVPAESSGSTVNTTGGATR